MRKYLPVILVIVVLASAGAFILFNNNGKTSSKTSNGQSRGSASTTNQNPSQSSTTTSTQPANTTQTPTAAGTTTVVSISDFAFNPNQITIRKGSKVTWVNKDSMPHTVTSDAGSTTLASGTLQSGDSFSFTFNEAGAYNYHCTIHISMKGSVVVTD